jgi:ABC-type transport system involved in multi-copper enzyme maturation permease subunit
MILHIARKEFHNNLLSARFVIGFLLCLVLIPFSVLLGIGDYRDQMSQFRVDQAAAEKTMKEIRTWSFLRPILVFPPEPLGIFGNGISGQIGNQVKIRLGEKPLLPEGKTAARDNPFLASFFSVDFVDIAAIVLSLLALLFSYDALTKEKEDGTLRQQMANPLPRSTLLAGKLVGILMTLLPVLVFCFLVGGLIVLFSGDLAFSAREWGRLALLGAVSLAYLVLFVLVGMFVSARSRSSVSSLVLCLFLWVFLVFIVPNMASYAAESFVPTKSRDNLAGVMKDMDRGLRERETVAEKGLTQPDWFMNMWMNGGEDGGEESYGCSASYFEYKRQRNAIVEPMRIANADAKGGPQAAYLESLSRQARAAENLAMISPAGIFRAVAGALCGTDRAAQEKRMGDVRRYRETFIAYLKGKDIFARFEYFTPTPPSSMITADAMIAIMTGGRFKTMAEYDAWANKQTDFKARWDALKAGELKGAKPEDYPYLVANDMPWYAERRESVAGSLEGGAVVRLGLLASECLILFALAYVAFIRYDVR